MDFLHRKLHQLRIIGFLGTILLVYVYFVLQGHQGNAVHMLRQDKNIYVSMGDFGQVVFFEVFKESLSAEQKSLDFVVEPEKKIATLEAQYPKALASKIEKKGEFRDPSNFVATGVYSNTLYMLDAWKGIKRVKNEFQDQGEPRLMPFYGAQDLLIQDNLAYVTAGEAGLYIYDLSSANREIIARFDTAGFAESVFVGVRQVTTVKPSDEMDETAESLYASQYAQPERVKTLQKTAYVADGLKGVKMLDVTNPFTPTAIIETSLGGYTHRLVQDSIYLYSANGEHGLAVADISVPEKLDTIKEWPTESEVLDVAVNDQLIVAANGSQGLMVFRKEARPQNLPDEPILVPVDGFAYSVELVNNYAIVSLGEAGIRLIDLANPEFPVERGRAITPGTYTYKEYQQYRGSPQDTLEGKKAAETFQDFRTDVIFLLASVLLWMFYFYMTIWRVSGRAHLGAMLFWIWPFHGHPLMVQNGELISPREREHYETLRAIWLDTASAAVVQRRRSQRTVGPGLAFMRRKDRLARTLDLRPETVRCGPVAGEDPFAAKSDQETEQVYQERQERRQQTSGQTRDAIEIVPTIRVHLRVNAQPGAGDSQYGFDAETAGLTMQPEIYEYDDLLPFAASAREWRQLPATLVHRLWLHYLRLFSLQELFTPLPDPGRVFGPRPTTGLERVRQMILRHLTQRTVPRLDDHGQPVGSQQQSTDFQELERRGLKVIDVQVAELRLCPQAVDTFLDTWRMGWLPRVQQQVQDLQRTEEHLQQSARQNARRRFTAIVRRSLDALLQRPGAQATLPSEALASLVQGTLNLRELTELQRQNLNALLAWLEGWVP